MPFKSYTGPDKYHFRVYKKGKAHPFIVAVVEETEIDGKIFCHKYHKECSLDEYPGCSSFAYGMAHYYSASNGFLPVGAMEDCAYRNRIIFVDDFLQNESESAK